MTTSATGPGPTCALAPPTFARAFEGGGRLERTAAATTALRTSSTSPATSRRSSDAAPGASSGRSRYASSRGRVRSRFTAASSIAALRRPIFTSSVWPYEVCHSDANVGMCTSDAPMPEPIRTSTDTNAVFEKRGTQTTSPAMRRATEKLRHMTSSPISPPTQIEPATRWSQSKRSVAPRGDVCAACPASPGRSNTAAAAATAPVTERISAMERRSRSGRSIHSVSPPASTNSANTISRSTSPRPKADARSKGNNAPRSNAERNANCAVAATR